MLIVLSLLLAQSPALSGIPLSTVKAKPADSALVARVNGVPINAGDIDKLLWDWRHREVEQDLINYLTVKTAADAAGISASEEEVHAELETFLKRFSQTLSPGQDPKEVLSAQGAPPSRLFLKMRTQVLLRKLQLKDFKPADYVRVATIVFGGPGLQGDALKSVVDKANQSFDKLQQGGSWDAALASTTTDANVLNSHGELGWKALAAFPKPTRDLVQSTMVGHYTAPQVTANGIQIFRVEAKGAEVKGDDLKALQDYFVAATRGQFVSALQAKTNVERVQ